MISRSTKWLCVVMLTVDPGCGESDRSEMCVAPVIEHGAVTFQFFGTTSDEFCPSSFDAVVTHAQWVAEALGAEPANLEYELFGSREEPCWPCPLGITACGIAGRLGTTRLPDRHETVHAARGTNCTSLIEEGWATLYGNPFEGGEMVGTLRDAVAGIEEHGQLPGVYYPLAARFVAYVLESHGFEALRDLCEIRLTNEAEIDVALQNVLGSSLEEVQFAFDAYPPWTLGELRQDRACEGIETRLAPTSWTLELGCMVEGVEGKLGGTVWNHQLIELPESGSYTFEFASSSAVELWIELRSCQRDGLASTYYDVGLRHPQPDHPETWLRDWIPAGIYVVRAMVRDAEPDLSIDIDITMNTWP